MIEFEKWAPMPGFPGYVIGDQGHAARVLPDGRRERIAPIVQGGRLYYRMRFRKHRCLLLAERAVAEAFIQSSPVGYGISHIDGDPMNCRADNLAVEPWMSTGYRICKIDAKGRILEEYTSAAEAARNRAWLTAAVLHGLYDFLLVAFGAVFYLYFIGLVIYVVRLLKKSAAEDSPISGGSGIYF